MNYIIEPVIGAFIGCFTNYIAIKMLFRPYTKKKLFGITIPFTPGIIPKRKNVAAKTIGNVVEKDLLDKGEIINVLCSDSISTKITESIMNYIIRIPESFNDQFIGDFAVNILLNLNLKEIFSNEIYNYINEKIGNNIAFKFIGDKMISGIADGIGEKIQNYMENDGKKIISETINNEFYKLSGMRIEDVLIKYDIDVLKIKLMIREKYTTLITEKINTIFDNIDISGIVERKVNSMDMKELEKLVLMIMKKELNAVVYLGALIGFLIGTFNIVFSV